VPPSILEAWLRRAVREPLRRSGAIPSCVGIASAACSSLLLSCHELVICPTSTRLNAANGHDRTRIEITRLSMVDWLGTKFLVATNFVVGLKCNVKRHPIQCLCPETRPALIFVYHPVIARGVLPRCRLTSTLSSVHSQHHQSPQNAGLHACPRVNGPTINWLSKSCISAKTRRWSR
jgi:hypothetical protein